MKTRMKISVIAVLFALLFLVSGDSLSAQMRRTGSARSPATPRAQLRESTAPLEFDSRPFDISADQLPPLYMGVEPGLLYNRMRSGEKGGGYAFRLDVVERSYDVEKQVLQVFCELSSVLEDGKADERRRGFRVKYQPQLDNRYTSNDGQGKKIEIEEIKFREYAVVFTNFAEFPVERLVLPNTRRALEKEQKKTVPAAKADESLKREVIVGKIQLAPKAARNVGEAIMVLAVCELVEPYATSDVVWQRPTPEKLREYMGQYFYLHARLVELWFYDFETGSVLERMKAGGASRTP
jgi:hypothetical protein